MTVTQINSLNIFLIAISLAAALLVPFDVFLLSYAILGPLHYLTEISWLHDREYFVSGRRDWVPLWLLGLAGTAFTPGVFGAEPLFLRIPWLGDVLGGVLGDVLYGARFDIGFLALGAALTFVVTQQPGARLAIFSAVLIALQIYRTDSTFVRIFAVYLPTVIHVFIFTGLFMISGALKSRGHSGTWAFGAFLFAAGVAALAPAFDLFTVSDWGRENFGVAFHALTASLLSDFGGVRADRAFRVDLFAHPKAIPVVRFLAFAYTYHYLNWFSKTSIIGWHQISASRAAAIVGVWLASLGLYYYDYRLGLSWLFLLSFGHVVLEFPLNFRSLHTIAMDLRARLASA